MISKVLEYLLLENQWAYILRNIKWILYDLRLRLINEKNLFHVYQTPQRRFKIWRLGFLCWFCKKSWAWLPPSDYTPGLSGAVQHHPWPTMVILQEPRSLAPKAICLAKIQFSLLLSIQRSIVSRHWERAAEYLLTHHARDVQLDIIDILISHPVVMYDLSQQWFYPPTIM